AEPEVLAGGRGAAAGRRGLQVDQGEVGLGEHVGDGAHRGRRVLLQPLPQHPLEVDVAADGDGVGLLGRRRRGRRSVVRRALQAAGLGAGGGQCGGGEQSADPGRGGGGRGRRCHAVLHGGYGGRGRREWGAGSGADEGLSGPTPGVRLRLACRPPPTPTALRRPALHLRPTGPRNGPPVRSGAFSLYGGIGVVFGFPGPFVRRGGKGLHGKEGGRPGAFSVRREPSVTWGVVLRVMRGILGLRWGSGVDSAKLRGVSARAASVATRWRRRGHCAGSAGNTRICGPRAPSSRRVGDPPRPLWCALRHRFITRRSLVRKASHTCTSGSSPPRRPSPCSPRAWSAPRGRRPGPTRRPTARAARPPETRSTSRSTSRPTCAATPSRCSASPRPSAPRWRRCSTPPATRAGTRPPQTAPA